MFKNLLGMTFKAETKRKELECSSVLIVYPSRDGKWRGFVHPYDITIEAENKDKAIEALKDMRETYEDMLKEYKFPEHLREKPFSNHEDSSIFNEIALEALTKQGKVNTSRFYAEAV